MALAADPADRGLLERNVALRMRRGDLHGASRLFREAADTHPERLDLQLGYADFLVRSSPGDATARVLATRVLEAALRRQPSEPAVFGRLFRLYENGAQRDASLALYRQLVAAPRDDAGFWLALLPMARTLLPGDSEESRQALDTIHRSLIKLEPLDPGIAREAADYFRQTRRLDEAIDILRAHAAASPGSLEIRIRLGILLMAKGASQEGIDALRAVVAVDQDLPLAHQALAKALESTGDPAGARHHRAELIRIRGAGPREFITLADEYLAAGQPREARLLLEKAIFQYPDHPLVAARLAIASAGDPQTAAAAAPLFAKAEDLARVHKSPEAIDPAFRQAYSKLLAATPDAAEAQLRAAIRSIPPDQPKQLASALRDLARLWQAANKNEAAAAALLQRAAKLDPDGASGP